MVGDRFYHDDNIYNEAFYLGTTYTYQFVIISKEDRITAYYFFVIIDI